MKKILYISFVDWYWIKQRPQHFAEILSKNYFVTYICQRSWKKDSNIIVQHEMNDTNFNKKFFYQNKNLFVIRKRLIPKAHKFFLIKKLNTRILRNILYKLDKKNNYDVIIITHPNQYSIVPSEFFYHKKTIYDCMDNYSEFNGIIGKETLINDEKKLLSKCNHIVVSSINLYRNLLKKESTIKNNLSVINNGVDIEKFNLNNIISANNVNILKDTKNIKVGYIGTIGNWVDFHLIKRVAQNNKDIDFYFVGPIERGLDISIFKNNNVIFTGAQPYGSVPNILNKLDVAIMPFVKNELVDCVNPVKIYEYLALGKPVLALKYEETKCFEDLIYTYDSDIEFQEKLNDAINEDGSKIVRRIEFASKHTWNSRVDSLAEIIDKI